MNSLRCVLVFEPMLLTLSATHTAHVIDGY